MVLSCKLIKWFKRFFWSIGTLHCTSPQQMSKEKIDPTGMQLMYYIWCDSIFPQKHISASQLQRLLGDEKAMNKMFLSWTPEMQVNTDTWWVSGNGCERSSTFSICWVPPASLQPYIFLLCIFIFSTMSLNAGLKVNNKCAMRARINVTQYTQWTQRNERSAHAKQWIFFWWHPCRVLRQLIPKLCHSNFDIFLSLIK